MSGMSTAETGRLEEFIRPKDLPRYTGNAVSTNYADAAAGLICPPVKCRGRSSGFLLSEVAAVQKARIAGKTEDEIRELVRQLVAKRVQPETIQ